MVLFAALESIQEALGFSPFEFVLGRTVRGEDITMNLLDHVSDLCEKLHTATELVEDNLKSAQQKMKVWYDKKAQKWTLKPGDKVLVILPIPGHPLRARFCGPYIV